MKDKLIALFTIIHEIIIYAGVGKYCFPNQDLLRYFSVRSRYTSEC